MKKRTKIKDDPAVSEISMPRRLFNRWLRALRSDTYEQTAGTLTTGNAFCCLGVLADVQGCTWHENKIGRLQPILKGKDRPQKSDGYLGPDLSAGVPRKLQHQLADFNDDNYGFRKIADWLEAKVKPVGK